MLFLCLITMGPVIQEAFWALLLYFFEINFPLLFIPSLYLPFFLQNKCQDFYSHHQPPILFFPLLFHVIISESTSQHEFPGHSFLLYFFCSGILSTDCVPRLSTGRLKMQSPLAPSSPLASERTPLLSFSLFCISASCGKGCLLCGFSWKIFAYLIFFPHELTFCGLAAISWFFPSQGFSVLPWLSWKSLCKPGWPTWITLPLSSNCWD